MDFVHKMIDSDKLADIFDLPNSLRSRKVEVIILPAPDSEPLPNNRGSAFGCLRKYANPTLISQEDGVWEQAVISK